MMMIPHGWTMRSSVIAFLVLVCAGSSASQEPVRSSREGMADTGRVAPPPVVAPAPVTYYPRRFSLTDENDAFGGSSDSSYTQGLRVSWDVGSWPSWKTVSDVFPWVSGAFLLPRVGRNPPRYGCDEATPRPCGALRFSIGQTMYTPPDLVDMNLNPTTRPYVGHLFVSAAAIEKFTQFVVTSELQVGIVGPAAGARQTQSLAHWINAWEAPRPLGWQHQLKNSFQASIRNSYAGTLLEFCANGCNGSRRELRLFDVGSDAEVLLGWPMTRFSAGASARIGFGFP